MSLYREAGRGLRRIAIVAAVAAAVGLVAGFLVGRETRGTPSLAEKIAQARDDYGKLPDALELVKIEYPQAVRGNTVVAQTEYDAAKADVRRARDALAEIRGDLRAIAPQRADLAERQLRDLQDLVAKPAQPEQVLNQVQKVLETLNETPVLGTAG
jgi:hypothetical protein